MQRRKSIQASLSSVNLSWISFPSVTAIVVKEHKRSFAPLQSVLHVQLSLQNHYWKSPEDDSSKILWMSLPLHDSACSADTSDFLPPLNSTGARGAVILWPETHIPKYFKSTVWQGYRECYFRFQYPTTNWQRGELSKTENYHKSASKITATVRGHQIFIRNLTKSSLLIPDSLPENCWFSARGTKHLVVHTGKEYCISRWHFSSWAALK